METYIVATDTATLDNEVLQELQPPRLLLSYFYFKNKTIKDYTAKLGYSPKVLLDSGAYSAFTKGRNIAVIDYINYIKENQDAVDHYIALDVIGDPEVTYAYYEIMISKGLDPIPVYHYGASEKYLSYYLRKGARYIALGATVPVKNKCTVAAWVKDLITRYPGIDFHLLGSSSKKIIGIPGLRSSDSASCWLRASKGYPREIPGKGRESNKLRAIAQIHSILEGDGTI